jgi:hypothetical protein
MNMKKKKFRPLKFLLVLLALSFFIGSVYAQIGNGWQTGNGFNNGISTPTPAPTPTPTPTHIPTNTGNIGITWAYGTAPIIVSSGGVQYYFRSDTYTTLGVQGYGFDSDYTNTARSINETYSGTDPVTFGFQVYLFNSPTSYIELTSGTPDATFTLTSNYTNQDTGTFNMPAASVTLGYQALEVSVEEQYGTGSWVTVANYISPVLITNGIKASTWSFTLYVTNTQTIGNTYTAYTFGNTDYRSGVSGIIFSKPLQSDIAMWRLSRGDYIGFLLGEYADEVTMSGFLGMILFGIAASLYMRYRHFGTIAFLFAIFGGSGGIIWIFLPPWGAAVGSAIIILGTVFIMWRVLR